MELMIYIQPKGQFGGNKYIIIDNEDYSLVKDYSWSLRPSSNTFYAKAWVNGRTVLIHRLILGLKTGDKREVDHINRNALDNRKCNLRIVNSHEQNQNRSAVKNSASKYRGVYVAKCSCFESFRAALKKDGKYICEAVFATEDMAALFYDLISYKYNGEYAYLNFPDIDYYKISSIIRNEINKRKIKNKKVRKTKGNGNEKNIGKKFSKHTKYVGVGYRAGRKKPWYAFCYYNKKNRKQIGSYSTEEEAAIAFDNYIIENNVKKYLQHLNFGR